MVRVSKKEKERLEKERLEQERIAKEQEEKKRKRKIFIIILFFVLMLGILPALAKGIYDTITEQFIEITGGTRISAPVITGGSEEWQKEALIKIEKNAESNREITHYEYCVSESKDTSKCDWKVTRTKNAVISKTGKYYVTFRAVTDNEKTGKNSNQVIVYIDNNNPIVNKLNVKNITKDSITVEVDAKDNESGISKYLYSLDGKNYTEGKLNYTYTGLNANEKYRVYVKVVDKLGNEIVTSMEVTTNNADEPKNIEKPVEDKKDATKVEPEPTSTPEPTPEEPEIEWDMPTIDLVDVPAVFTYADKYDLPSHYDFGNDTGEVKCLVDGSIYTDTSNIYPGTHTIVCTATSNHGKIAEVEKDVEVELQQGEDEIFDGWIKLNLFFPSNSTNWEWRLGSTGIRTGYDNTGWEPYTGPILVKLEDVNNVFIRYEMNGETYIIAPNGKITVDIEPDSYSIKNGQKTNVTITYDKTATTKEYRIDGGAWQTYTGKFEVPANTIIEARAIRNEDVYDNNGNYQYTATITGVDSAYISVLDIPPVYPTGGSNPNPPTTWTPSGPGGVPTTPGGIAVTPTYYLVGPIITSTPTSLTNEVEVTVTPQDPADKIYYRNVDGTYQLYTGPFKVTKNGYVSAYYIRKSDGMISQTTFHYINNIKEPNLPYVYISANPNYLSNIVSEVEVTVGGSGYNTLEYSLDGVIYQTYTGPFKVKNSMTVYAKGTNDNGSRIETLTITTSNPPVPRDELNIFINPVPNSSSVVGLINEVEVTITYDSRATDKYYKLGSNDSWKPYTGPFKVNNNTTVYAYCTSSNGRGEESLTLDYLTTGISDPKIIADTSTPVPQVKVEITFDKNASVTRYKIGTGPYVDYTGPFYVSENTTITAYNKDPLGNEAYSTKTIKNIVTAPTYTLINKGGYYIIKLNYPDVSDIDSREYRWKENGVWKQYDPDLGILLIKPEYKSLILSNPSAGVLVQDENGNDVIYADHYYLVDVPLSEVFENLFMRWDNEVPAAPVITLNPDKTPTREVDVAITYSSTIATKYYKVVEPTGTDSGWQLYTGPFKVNKNNTIVYAKGINTLNTETKVNSILVDNIDEIPPTITLKGDLTTLKQKVPVTVSAKDDLGVDIVKYAEGKQAVDYFASNGTLISNDSTVVLTKDDTYYTFYAKDKVGNETVETIYIDNIDSTAPDMTITDLTQGFGIQSEISIDFGDSATKEYRVGNDGAFVPYPDSGNLILNASDVYDKAVDGVLTLYAKGTDSVGNSTTISEVIYTLDVDMPKAPIIHASIGYPMLTPYGVQYDDALTVTYASRNDIINYIDIGNGEGWKVYTGLEHISNGTIKAKSVKTSTGLETPVVTEDVNQPTDAVGLKAYDDDLSSYFTANYGTRLKIYISDDLVGKKVHVKTGTGYSDYNTVNIISDTNESLYSKDARNIDEDVLIKPGSKYFEFVSTAVTTAIYDVSIVTKPDIVSTKVYPKLTMYGYEEGYTNINISYFTTAVERYYKIDDGDWLNYTDKIIKLLPNQTIYAKSVDKFGNESKEEKLEFKPNDYIQKAAFDNDRTTNYATSTTASRLVISSELIGKVLNVYMQSSYAYSGNKVQFGFVNANGDLLDSVTATSTGYSGEGYIDTQITIPEGTVEAQAINLASTNGKIYEVSVDTAPIFHAGELNLPKLSSDGIVQGSTDVTIDYYYDSVTKLYKIDDGNWQTYQDNPINLLVGHTIYAKGIDKDNEVTEITNYKLNLPSDVLDYKAYDGDQTTSATVSKNTSSVFAVDTDGLAKMISVKSNAAADSKLKIYDTKNEVIKEVDLSETLVLTKLDTNANKLEFTAGNSALNVYEVELSSIFEEKTGDSILSILSDDTLTSGYYTFKVNNVDYPVHLIYFDTDQEWNTSQVFGDIGDVGTKTTYAENMVIVKVKGDLTVGENGKVEPYSTKYGGPKGFLLYVTGKLTNNGTIDNSHGAYAEGQDVYLWKNSDGSYEYVPAQGSLGGESYEASGEDAVGRQTGGGGAGTRNSASGGRGSSYSGGTGAGGQCNSNIDSPGSSVGGAAGTGVNWGATGAGNPGILDNGAIAGSNGTGGLLIIYSNEYENNGKLTAAGKNGGTDTGWCGRYGGNSGGGSINIFTNQSTNIDSLGIETNQKYVDIRGDYDVAGGTREAAHGGKGTINIGEIRNGNYYDLKDIIDFDKEVYKNSMVLTGDSILSILNNNLTQGYYIFRVTGRNDAGEEKIEDYPVHLYVYDTSQEWNEEMKFGDDGDISVDVAATSTSSSYRSYAKNMVIVKVNGDLTIGSEGSVLPYSTEYGGPKGFLLYVTGKLTNNGTIDNSHGAYAEGQDVYLWKNSDGSYEYVPAQGALGGESYEASGKDAVGRQTGGGGSGTRNSAPGGTGTSYSGGSGAGAQCNSDINSPGSSLGGAAGAGVNWGATGAGNPGILDTGATTGSNGTGGLLIIYANDYENNNNVTAAGKNGGTYTAWCSRYGGSSGGGSINIFYNNLSNKGTTSVVGGTRAIASGGAGSVTYTQLSSSNLLLGKKGVLKSNPLPQEDNSVVEEPIIKANVPGIGINTTELTETKTISIDYDDRYTREYSLDLGKTWVVYTEPITVSENTTVFARSVDENGKIVSASSFTITTIGVEEIENEKVDDVTQPDSETENTQEENVIEKSNSEETTKQEEVVLPDTDNKEDIIKPDEEGDGNE